MSATKNDPKNKALPRKKLMGSCGHDVVPVRIVPVKGGAKMMRWCEQCGVVKP